MSKTLYISEKQAKARGIDLSQFPSAGSYPSISGMKKLYWGRDALVVKCGVYIYKVPADVYTKCY